MVLYLLQVSLYFFNNFSPYLMMIWRTMHSQGDICFKSIFNTASYAFNCFLQENLLFQILINDWFIQKDYLTKTTKGSNTIN